MATLVFSHDDCLGHVTPDGHPERVERLLAVERGLAELAVERREAPMADDADVLLCHPARYLARVRAAVPDTGFVQMDGDTYLSPGSLDAALRAVGGVCAGVDAVSMYARELRLLEVFEERHKLTPDDNRWHPILAKQVEYFRARAREKHKHRRAEVGDPSSKEQRGAGRGGMERVFAAERAGMEEIARVIERHQHHNEAAQEVHGFEAGVGGAHVRTV